MVLNKGNIVEFDNPKKLLENKNGLFYELYQQSMGNTLVK
jgi:ABC-type multidrug transport system fused ATPase/permease subunit